ncbi:MAG: isoprenylcysteine carboxylmethyltransferase family protein [Acidobacteriota bacterium]
MPHYPVRLFPPPAIFLACIAAGALAQRFRPWLIAPYSFQRGLVFNAVAVLPALFIAGWAMIELRRHHTTIEPGHTPAHLVTSGPFRFTRNPLYLALLLISLGTALAVNSIWLLLTSVLLFVLLDRLVVVREERTIDEAFGDGYRSYVKRVRRWL